MYGELQPGVLLARETEARLTLAQARAVMLPSRIKIMRSLAQKRATITELCKRTGIPKSTVLKHLRALNRHGLVVQEEDERLWKYWDLTKAGRLVGKLDPLRILVLFSATIAIALFAWAIGLWWWSRQPQASDDPWGIPPIGVDPIESHSWTAIYALAATGAVLALMSAWLWWRARLPRAPTGPEDLTDTSSYP